jgi:hypothetical protein
MRFIDAEIVGLKKFREEMLARGNRARASFRRPNEFLGKEFVSRGRRLLDLALDIDGNPLKSRLAQARGRTPFGGAHGSYGKSLHYGHDGGDLKYFSTHPGADVAWSGKTLVPKTAKFFTIPVEADGGYAMKTTSRGGFSRGGLSIESGRTGRKARDYKDTFFKWIGGRLWLLQKEKDSKRLRFLFYLTKQTRHNVNKWAGLTTKPVGGMSATTDFVHNVYGMWVMEGRVA